MSDDRFCYDDSGVDTRLAQSGLGTLARSINETLRFRDGLGFGRPVCGLGYYANVLELPGGGGLAISTDGVGTKIIVAELAGRYDTIPIDMIAMNVNDLLCVGAEPFALVDYIATGEIDDTIFDQIGRGLLIGARESRITIPGGEIAQVKELLRGHGKSTGLDLVGTAVGWVPFAEVNLGQDTRPGDVVIGLPASGLHSNGFTLARRVLMEQAGLSLDQEIPELGCRLADELLRPTALYVRPVLALRDAGVKAHALLHITGDGFCNMNRIHAPVGFDLDALPEPGAIYRLIQERGSVSMAEMYSVFNMGIGFCVVVDTSDQEAALRALEAGGSQPVVIGRATAEHPNQVRLVQHGLIGGENRLTREV
ncbi:MAG: phosphoribosylformylglycinamidine cyclo-ligase [Planctomycetes bacterium]|nr:phosphoribosylformylglycinamidine cyclo-ligase [Planctomycetota bacterium]